MTRSFLAPSNSSCCVSCFYPNAVSFGFCFQIGVPSNLYALYHAAVQLKQKNELGVYLINLTVSDLLYLTSLPLWLQYIFQVNNSASFRLYEALPSERYLPVVPLYFTH